MPHFMGAHLGTLAMHCSACTHAGSWSMVHALVFWSVLHACTLLNMADAKRCVLCDALKGSSLAAASTLAQQRQTGRSPRNAEASEAGKTEGQRGSLAAFLSQTARGRGK